MLHYLKKILPVFAGIVFIAALAQATLHLPGNMGKIPVTGQSLAVLLAAFILRPPLGVLAVGAYVLLGTAGLPIFADGRSGMAVLLGGSGGFLLGFVGGALVLGRLGAIGWGRSFGLSLLAMAIGTAIILAAGLARLTMLYGLPKALEYGFFPFWQGAIVKIILGAAGATLYHKLASLKR